MKSSIIGESMKSCSIGESMKSCILWERHEKLYPLGKT